MELEVLSIDKALCPEAVGVLTRAFKDDPVILAVHLNVTPDERIQRTALGMSAVLEVCIRRGLPLYIKKDNSIVGVSTVYPPGTYPLPIATQLGILFKYVTKKGFNGVGRWIKIQIQYDKQHPKEPHYYLELIGVEPSLQGQGLGAFILRHIVDKADQDHMGCYLETSKSRNLPLYHRVGFQTVTKKKIIGVDIWSMWRPPGHKE